MRRKQKQEVSKQREMLLRGCMVFLGFSVSRPDCPLVPGRIRMEIDSDDFLIVPSGFVHVRRIDPRGHTDSGQKAAWYTGDRPSANLREMLRAN